MAALGGGCAAENETVPDAAPSAFAAFCGAAGFGFGFGVCWGALPPEGADPAPDELATGTVTSGLNGSLRRKRVKVWSCVGADDVGAAEAAVEPVAGTEPGA